jgi:ATP-dependent DNA ligase
MACSASATPLGFIKPEIPTLIAEPPTEDGWIHEIKHDGYRTLIVIDQGKVRAFSRHGRDWTRPYRRVVQACTKLPWPYRCPILCPGCTLVFSSLNNAKRRA